MIYTLNITSEESSLFSILLEIDESSTFHSLHKLIQEECEYDSKQLASFFTVSPEGLRIQEISLVELSSENIELNEAVMDVSTLNEFIGEKIKTLHYQFDFFGNRYFKISVESLKEGNLEKPTILKKEGTAPQQIVLDDEEIVEVLLNEEPVESDKEIDYEKYLNSFDDCNETDIITQSEEDLNDDELY